MVHFKKPPKLKDSTKLREETPETVQRITASPGSEEEHKGIIIPDSQEIQPSQIIAPSKNSNLKLMLLAAAAIGFASFALVDLNAHKFSPTTAEYWMSAFAVIGAAISLRRAAKRAFKKTVSGTIYLQGEDLDKAAMPGRRTFLIMLIIFLVFVAVMAYAFYNSAVSGQLHSL